MKRRWVSVVALIAALTICFVGGYSFAWFTAKGRMLNGPYSDDYPHVLDQLATAKAKVAAGDPSVVEELDRIEFHVKRSRNWAFRFITGGDKEYPTQNP